MHAGNQALPVCDRTHTATATAPSPGTAPSPDGDDGDEATGFAWRLPGDPGCAREARAHVRRALARLSLPGLVPDAEQAVSELAANAWEHALNPASAAPGNAAGPATRPELWLYRRGEPPAAEIVCGVFDTRCDAWPLPRRNPPGPRGAGRVRGPLLDAVLAADPGKGRGLTIVRALSHATGCHRTRSRRSVPAVAGKVVWFTLRIPDSSPAARPPSSHLTAAQAASALSRLLAARGIPAATRHDDTSGQSVVSTTAGLAVRCGNGIFRWSPGRAGQRAFADLADAAENAIRLHEELRDQESLMGRGSRSYPFGIEDFH